MTLLLSGAHWNCFDGDFWYFREYEQTTTDTIILIKSPLVFYEWERFDVITLKIIIIYNNLINIIIIIIFFFSIIYNRAI